MDDVQDELWRNVMGKQEGYAYPALNWPAPTIRRSSVFGSLAKSNDRQEIF